MEQDKDIIEISLVVAMMKLMGWVQNPKGNEDEIKALIHNLRKALDDFAKVVIKEDEHKNYEKHKTPAEAYNAWIRFCEAQNGCKGCKYENKECSTYYGFECLLGWLYNEADEDNKEKQDD